MNAIFDGCKESARQTVTAKINEVHSEVAALICPAKKLPLKISKNSQENMCWSFFINKVAGVLQLS